MIRVYDGEQYHEFETEESFQLFLRNYIFIQAAGGVVYNSKNELLMIRKNEKWDLPKGKIETNESPEITAIREISEETGVENLKLIKPLSKTYYIYPLGEQQVLKEVTWFLFQSYKDEPLQPQTEENIDDVKWVKIDKINDFLKMSYPSVRTLFAK